MPAESILNLELRPLFLTKSVNTPSAAGLLQMLPRHTKSTENGFVSVSVTVDGAIDARIGERRRFLRVIAEGAGFPRANFPICKEGRKNETFGVGERAWEEQWQNRKLMVFIPALYRVLIFFLLHNQWSSSTRYFPLNNNPWILIWGKD